ncbi:hypothetical protein [Corynebacterium confusum]|uniref:hypothetical protein n=1 Tax=Corynebacterium confusum TaxID=71254 RepID=UPI0025B4B3FE|nr:hypothetical protein [Corynebacterium confusum]WJY89695.1 hypothetical protein CCONF_05800 [Corynebacterium confusum]
MRTRRHQLLPLLAIGIVGWLVRMGVAARGWFYWDDFILMAQAPETALMAPHDGHLMPAARGIMRLVAAAGDLNWAAALCVLGLLNAAAIAAVGFLAHHLRGGWPVLLAFALYCLSPLNLPATSWLSAAINLLPLEAAMATATTCVLGGVRVVRDRSNDRPRAHVAGWAAALCVLVGCLFSERMLLALPFLAFCWFLLGCRRSIFPSLGVAVIWAGIYVLAVDLPRAESLGLAGTLRHGFLQGFLPAATGGPLAWDRWHPGPPFASPVTAMVAVGVIVAAAIVVLSARNRRGLAGLLTCGAYVAVCLLAVSLGRGGQDTAFEIVQTLRHFSEVSVLLVIATALAFRCLDSATWPGRILLALGAVIAALSIASTLSYSASWAEQPAREYFRTLNGQLAAPETPQLDQEVDTQVLLPVAYPDNRLSKILPGAAIAAWTEQPGIVGTDGRILAADLHPARSTTPTGAGDAGMAQCGQEVGAGQEQTLRLDGPLLEREWVVELNYLAGAEATAGISLDGERTEVPLRAGLNQVFVQVTGGGTELTVDLPEAASPICVQTSRVGTLWPAG